MTSIQIASLPSHQVRNYWRVARPGSRHRCIVECPSSSAMMTVHLRGYYYHPITLAHPFSTTTSNSTTPIDNSQLASRISDNIDKDDSENDFQSNAQSPTNTISSTSSSNTISTTHTTRMSQQLAELSKARLSALVVSTTAFGFISAGPTALALTSLPTFVSASVGTALCASSAATFNQIFEIERDRCMKRTGNRPLVTGVVSKEMAMGLGCFTGTSGGLILGLGTDPITTMLGVGNIGLYAGLYTYLKPKSEINTWIGAVVGAIPPVMGWTAAGGSLLDAEAMLMGATLFLWQFPHFFALNWMYRTDYKRGGFAMVAVNDPNGDRTASLIQRYGLYLASLPFISTALEVTSPMFAVDAGILLNGYALHVASKFNKERSNASARKVFLTSLWYLPCLMMLFLLHSRRWHEKIDDDVTLALGDEKEEEVTEVSILVKMQKIMNDIQSKGRELCMHEAIASEDVEIWVASETKKAVIDGSKCPISIGKAVAESTCTSIASKQELTSKHETQGVEGSSGK